MYNSDGKSKKTQYKLQKTYLNRIFYLNNVPAVIVFIILHFDNFVIKLTCKLILVNNQKVKMW